MYVCVCVLFERYIVVYCYSCTSNMLYILFSVAVFLSLIWALFLSFPKYIILLNSIHLPSIAC
jgi:hypothetical protein